MKRFNRGDFLWLAVLAGVTALIAAPPTHAAFVQLTTARPYLMGFIKFAILASMGELLAVRLGRGVWKQPPGFGYKVIVWGLLGIAITAMFSFFSLGVAAMFERGLFPVADSAFLPILRAFTTAALMNLTFGPVFMAVHRLSDTCIDRWVLSGNPSTRGLVAAVDWAGFLSFVVGKTIPLFWIPAHTLTFLLPGEYRVLVAAYLSIVLGVILVYARGRKSA